MILTAAKCEDWWLQFFFVFCGFGQISPRSEGVRSSALDMFYFKESTFDFLMKKISKTIFGEKIRSIFEEKHLVDFFSNKLFFSYWKIDFLK